MESFHPVFDVLRGISRWPFCLLGGELRSLKSEHTGPNCKAAPNREDIPCRGNLSLELYGKVQSALRKGLERLLFWNWFARFSTGQAGFGSWSSGFVFSLSLGLCFACSSLG